MLLGRVLCVTLFLSVHSYNDYLTHTALDRVPATIGDPLQIRCTKMLEKNTDEIRGMARCDPYGDDKCYHVWTKDGKGLPKGEKYSFKSSITFDYCENFERSTDIVKKLKVDVGKVDNSGTWYDREMKCYASALTINNVEEDDLGDYQCHFAKKYAPFVDPETDRYGEVQSINVYNRKSSVPLPKKVEYFENFYTKGVKSKLLMQCVVTGATAVHWFISEKCPRGSSDKVLDKCGNNTMQPLEDIAGTLDTWHCFNFTTESHNPYQDVTESFIYFESICAMDWGSIYCSADAKGVVLSEGGYIVEKKQWDNWNYRYETEETTAILGCILIPIVIGLFFLIGAILACVRGKVCSCCNGGNLGARAHPQYQQPVFTYNTANVAPQPGNAPPRQGYAPPQQGYAPPQQGYAPPQQGYALPNAPPTASGSSRTAW